MSTRLRASVMVFAVCLATAVIRTDARSAQPAPPPASAGHSLVYVDHLQMVVLVNAGLGGESKPAASTPTRLWGWTGGEWRLLDAGGPPIRNLAGVAYDSRRRVLVMHGGSYDFGVSYGDTWEWSAAGWRRFEGAGPGVRDHAQMAYDANRGRCVLFGGSGDDPNVAFGDTWEFDGTRWERVAMTGAPARIHHAMQYDPLLRRVVVFGGMAPGGPSMGVTWSWDGTQWATLGAPMAPRTHARMAFDRRLGALVVAGSLSAQGLGLLVRKDNAWSPLAVDGEPSARYLTDMAFDEKRNVLVLFGGGQPRSSALYADTWEFDGTAWRRVG